jgi:hypothetical protein
MDKWVDREMYIRKPTAPDFRPLKEAIDAWSHNEDYEEYDGFYGGSEDYVERGYDTVSRPKHYMLFDINDLKKHGHGIEVRDVIRELVAKIANKTGQGDLNWSPLAESDYVQMMQYLMRFMDKNGVEDLKKARWYLDKLVEAYEHPQLDT